MLIAAAVVSLAVIAGLMFLTNESKRSGGKAKLRTDGLRAAGERMGLRFEELSSLREEEGYAQFPLFKTGNPYTTLRNLMTGVVKDNPATVFDFKYATTQEIRQVKTNAYYEQTVALLLVRARSLPWFELRPEGVLDKLKGAVGYQDIDFASHPGFSSGYFLRGKDEGAVRALFGPKVLDYLQEHPGWCVQGGGGWVVFFKHDTLVQPSELEAFLREAAEAFLAF